MEQSSSRIIIQTELSFFVINALTLLLLPLKWVAAWLIASVVHELGHYLALRAFRNHIHTITFSHSGVVMHTEPLGVFPAFICSLAGPLCGILLLFFVHWFPYLGICGTFQSIFNLLPICPLDGGRALDAILFAFFADHIALRMERIIKWGTLCILFILSLYFSLTFDRGFICLLVYSMLLLKVCPLKIPCKHRNQIVQ